MTTSLKTWQNNGDVCVCLFRSWYVYMQCVILAKVRTYINIHIHVYIYSCIHIYTYVHIYVYRHRFPHGIPTNYMMEALLHTIDKFAGTEKVPSQEVGWFLRLSRETTNQHGLRKQHEHTTIRDTEDAHDVPQHKARGSGTKTKPPPTNQCAWRHQSLGCQKRQRAHRWKRPWRHTQCHPTWGPGDPALSQSHHQPTSLHRHSKENREEHGNHKNARKDNVHTEDRENEHTRNVPQHKAPGVQH